jgi:hypothetical protein
MLRARWEVLRSLRRHKPGGGGAPGALPRPLAGNANKPTRTLSMQCIYNFGRRVYTPGRTAPLVADVSSSNAQGTRLLIQRHHPQALDQCLGPVCVPHPETNNPHRLCSASAISVAVFTHQRGPLLWWLMCPAPRRNATPFRTLIHEHNVGTTHEWDRSN